MPPSVIFVPSADPKTWRINGKPVDLRLEELTPGELQALLSELERRLLVCLRARRAVRKEIERRKG